MSAIRLVDRVTFLLDDEGSVMNPLYPVTFVVALKADQARGSHTLKIRKEKPSGEQEPVLEAPVFLEGEERGANIILNAAFQPDQPGLYWYDILFNEERLTRVPLRAIYQPMATAGSGG